MKLSLGLSLTTNKSSGVAPGLLDTFTGAKAAYSLRYLSNDYTGDVIEVRRSSDSATEGFTPDEILDGTLATFVGASTDWFVTNIYDQIGTNHLTQSAPAKQPKIGASSALLTLNGKPTIQSDGTTDIMQSPIGAIGSVTNLTIFSVGRFTTTGQANDLFFGVSDGAYSSGDNYFIYRQLSGNNSISVQNPSKVAKKDHLVSDTNQHLFYQRYEGATIIVLGVDGTQGTNTSGIPASLNLSQEIDLFAANSGASDVVHGEIQFQELIIFDSNQSVNKAAIEAAINAHYSIY